MMEGQCMTDQQARQGSAPVMSHRTGPMAKPSVDFRRQLSSTCGAYFAKVMPTYNKIAVALLSEYEWCWLFDRIGHLWQNAPSLEGLGRQPHASSIACDLRPTFT